MNNSPLPARTSVKPPRKSGKPGSGPAPQANYECKGAQNVNLAANQTGYLFLRDFKALQECTMKLNAPPMYTIDVFVNCSLFSDGDSFTITRPRDAVKYHMHPGTVGSIINRRSWFYADRYSPGNAQREMNYEQPAVPEELTEMGPDVTLSFKADSELNGGGFLVFYRVRLVDYYGPRVFAESEFVSCFHVASYIGRWKASLSPSN